MKGVFIGHFTNDEAGRGVTVILFRGGAVASCEVMGGGPASRELVLLEPGRMIRKIHGVVFSGGSAFGLEAASGVMDYLEERGIGYNTGTAVVPLVPALSIYDLALGQKDLKPTKEWGYKAASVAEENQLVMGRIGAGAGATCGKFLGIEYASRTGVGIVEEDGILVLAVPNPLGNIIDPKTGQIIAGCRNPRGEGYIGFEEALKYGKSAFRKDNTTLVLVVLEDAFSKEELKAISRMAHIGIGRTISPSHTPFDGDAVIAASLQETGGFDGMKVLMRGDKATELVSKAILRAVQA